MIDINKMCVFGAKTALAIKYSKEQALEFILSSLLKNDELKLIEDQVISIAKEAIDKIYQSTDNEKVRAEFDAAALFMQDYVNSDGKDVDDKGYDEADRATISVLEVLSKHN